MENKNNLRPWLVTTYTAGKLYLEGLSFHFWLTILLFREIRNEFESFCNRISRDINFIEGEWSGFTNRIVFYFTLKYFNEINCRKRPEEFCKFGRLEPAATKYVEQTTRVQSDIVKTEKSEENSKYITTYISKYVVYQNSFLF